MGNTATTTKIYESIEKMIDSSQYAEATNLIAESFGLNFKCEFIKNDFHFQGDKEKRDIYRITLSRGQRKYSFDFGQSIVKSGFYAKYGVNKYELPREKMNLKNHELKTYVKMNFNWDFGNVSKDEIFKPIEPTLYDVLACLQKYDVGTFDDFCSEFGYDTDGRSARKTYKAVCKEFDKVCSLFNNDEIEVLQLIS